MKKRLIIPLIALVSGAIWFQQDARRESALQNNDLLVRRILSLEAGLRETDAQAAKDAEDLTARVNALPKPVVPETQAAASQPLQTLVAPDASRQGGWPKNTAYFYLPKSQLTNLNYRLLQDGRLTDDAATLFGMTKSEKTSVDEAFKRVLDNFRQMELAKIHPVSLPNNWSGPGSMFETGVAFQVPDLSDQVSALKQGFSLELADAVGSSRAGWIAQTAQSFFRDNLDDLGGGERTIGYLWQAQSDGSKSLWYGVADARHGEGAFERVPENPASDSQIAYYAKLLGLNLPGQ